MATPHRRAVISLIAALTFAAPALLAQSRGDALLGRGFELFGNRKYDESLRVFRDVILDSGLRAYHGDAYFWTAKAYLALDRYEEAERNLEFFIRVYPDNANLPEALYQRGRILYLQSEYDSAVLALSDFTTRFPDSPFVANGLYWIGEALYALGDFTRATAVFSVVVDDYPDSFRVEAARYRISLIELRERERELLRLLKWSHEEYLRAVEDFQRKEKSYAQAIASYQRRIAADESVQLGNRIEELQRRVAALESDLATARASASGDAAKLAGLMERALELKATYLEWLKTHDAQERR